MPHNSVHHSVRGAVTPYYNQPWRRYHNWAHISQVWASIDWSLAKDRDALELAVFCHDAVYVPGSKLNELASSVMALSFALPHSPEASRLIRLTQYHEPGPGDVDGVMLCNADLWGLGASPATYLLNGMHIYEEVKAYVEATGVGWSDIIWRDGRSKWLRSFLTREYIYRGDGEIYREREAQARANMWVELDGLDAHG